MKQVPPKQTRATPGPRSHGGQLKRLLFSLLGRWHWIALGLVLGILFGFYQVSKSQKIYRATATLLVKARFSQDGLNDLSDPSGIDKSSSEAMNIVVKRLKRMDLLERVAARSDVCQLDGLVPEETSLVPDWAAAWFGGKPSDGVVEGGTPEPAAVAAKMSNWMQISIRKGTRLIDVSIEHPVPEVAKALADAVAREFISEMKSVRTAERNWVLDLLVRESEKARNLLRLAFTAHASYRRALETHALLKAKETEVAALTFLNKHPRMIAGKSELKELNEQFLAEFEATRLAQTDKQYWETVTAEWDATADDKEQRLVVARRLLLSRTSVLESEMKSLEQVCTALLTRIQEVDLDQEAEAEIQISNLARIPREAIRPNQPMILAKAGIGGLALGLGLAFLLVKFDS